MPIKARTDMLTTGVRTPIGIKDLGSNPSEIERIGADIENALKYLRGTRSAFAERVAGGYFLDIEPRREQLSRYGLTIDQLQMVIITSDIGWENISTTTRAASGIL
jgi:Cu(I)/Ag(I) efflux system membrane protein CusA/SilA